MSDILPVELGIVFLALLVAKIMEADKQSSGQHAVQCEISLDLRREKTTELRFLNVHLETI
jgi:hypothetical protein